MADIGTINAVGIGIDSISGEHAEALLTIRHDHSHVWGKDPTLAKAVTRPLGM